MQLNRRLAAWLLAVFALNTHPSIPRTGPDGFAGNADFTRVKALAGQGYTFWTQHRYPEAISVYQRGYSEAERLHSPAKAWWFRNAEAGADHASGEYRRALDAYLAARDIALRNHLWSEAAVTLSNLSSLYLHVSDTAAALATIREAWRLLPADRDSPERTQILVQYGRVLLICGEGEQAAPLFEEAIESAFRRGDASLEAFAWDQMGVELLRGGDLTRAESALSTAFRLRLLTRDENLFATEHHLAILNLKKGNLILARHLIDAAFSHKRQDRVQLPLHLLYLARAGILRAEGHLRPALEDYVRATDAASEWRSRGLPADSFRVSADVFLDEIYNGAVDTAVELYRRSGDRDYAVLAWRLNELIRAASLREQLSGDREWTRHVPQEYWLALDRLRSLEAGRYTSRSASLLTGSDETARLRIHLAEMEAHAGSQRVLAPQPRNGIREEENFVHRVSLTHFRKVLGSSRTLISFHMGANASYRWLISRNRFELRVLQGRSALVDDIARLRSAVRGVPAEFLPASRKVYSDLFAGISQRSAPGEWLIALDDELFKLPVEALVSDERQKRPVYLVQRRAVQLVPGAWAVSDKRQDSRSRSFLGIGDAVFNTADPRYRTGESESANSNPLLPVASAAALDSLELPRLIASGREVISCGRRAGGAQTILTGTAVNRRRFLEAIASEPRIIHIASHFLPDQQDEGKTAIVLGLSAGGRGRAQLELLTVDDIASLRTPGAIVVMSGCSSAAGRAVPAAGLLGLARAWLVAGASAVIAAQWPTPDDTGAMFARFYDHLRETDAAGPLKPAEALRRAQVDMLQSRTWRADPQYWASYQIIGRSEGRP